MKKTTKVMARPKLSMSLTELVSRYTRGLPVETKILEGANHPDAAEDLEKLSRMDRVEKAYYASVLREENERKLEQLRLDEEKRRADELEEQERAEREVEEQHEKEAPPKGGASKPPKKGGRGAGIEGA